MCRSIKTLRTPQGPAGEDEVRAALASPEDFVRGPRTLTRRGTDEDDGPAFVVEDGSYVSARWPGDAYLFARRFIDRLG